MRSLSGQKGTDAAAQGGRHHGYGGAGIFRPQTHCGKSACGGGETGHKTGGIPGGPSADRDSARAAGKDSAPSADRGNAPSTSRDSARAAGYGDVSGARQESVRDRGTNPSPYAFDDRRIPVCASGGTQRKSCTWWVKKSRSYVEMASMHGLMRITPVAPDIIRVSFVKGVMEKIAATGWMAKAEEASHGAPESKALLRLLRGEITVWVDKRSGAVSF